MTKIVCTSTHVPQLNLLFRGKVRDVYTVGDLLLLVATDRISAFDSILPDGIPGKGRVLTQLSRFWFESVSGWMPSHFISTDLNDIPVDLGDNRSVLEGRTMICRRSRPIPVECVVRGYLSGSGWKEYCENGKVCGIPLTAGLKENARLDLPIFTPATKATSGHDENISFAQLQALVGPEVADRLRDASLRIFDHAARYAETRGLILSDTKFEFGWLGDQLVVIDELLTPDSSRYWEKSSYLPGEAPRSLDKQFVRDYLMSIGWNKEPPPPHLSESVIQATADRYLQAYSRITGQSLS
jgi:phosphoribosylaminoimidazole-succinocarboxamide synthase